MRKTKKKRASKKTSQPYDTSLKGWVKAQPDEILPLLLPGAEFIEAIDIERIKPPMRVDRVFKILYYEEPHLFHIEFESGADTQMPSRLLAYNSLLYHEHEIPVISMIVYPFQTTVAISPLDIRNRGGKLHEFHFLTLPLFTLEAERYMREHLTAMYPLLPSMEGVSTEIIEEAMAELAALYRGDETTLSQQFAWMQVLLGRTTMLKASEKATIGEKLKMYDPLWEQHPRVKKIYAKADAIVAQGRAQNRAEQAQIRAEFEMAMAELEAAKAEVKAEAEAQIAQAKAKLEEEKAKTEAEAKVKQEAMKTQLQKAMVYVVRARFPEPSLLAQESVQCIDNPDVLSFLLEKVESAANEMEARGLLRPPAA